MGFLGGWFEKPARKEETVDGNPTLAEEEINAGMERAYEDTLETSGEVDREEEEEEDNEDGVSDKEEWEEDEEDEMKKAA